MTQQATAIALAPESRRVRLSYEQQRLWFLEQLTPGGLAYCMPSAARLSGPLDYRALDRTFTEIVRRHDVLRSHFDVEAGQPVLIIRPPAPVTVPVIDLRGDPDCEARAAAAVADEAMHSFDLRNGPLLRVVLFRIADREHILGVTMHHAVSDGWSGAVLVREFAMCYEAFSTGRAPDLPPLALQYADYAEWQWEWLESSDAREMMRYWKERLEGDRPVFALSPDRALEHGGDLRVDSYKVELPWKAALVLKSLATREGSTFAIALFSILAVLLSRLTGQTDVVVGASAAKRTREEIEALIGVFLNMVVLRLDVSGHPTFRALMARAREVALGAYAHQELPFDRVVEAVRPNRAAAELPLVSILFNYQQVGTGRFDLGALSIETIRIAQREFHHPLAFQFEDTGETLRLELLYQTALFSPERIRAIADQFVLLFEQIAADPDRPMSAYSLVPPSAVRVLPDPEAPLPQREYEPVMSTFLRYARQHPHDPAIQDAGTISTYGTVADDCTRLAELLVGSGLTPGDRLVIAGPKSYGLIVAVAAAFAARAVVLVLDPETPVLRAEQLCSLAPPRFVLHVVKGGLRPWNLNTAGATTLGTIDAATAEAKSWTNRAPAQAHRHAGHDVARADDAAYIVFTSGTTGRPKGVLGRQDGLSHFVTWERTTFGIGAGDRCPFLASLTVDVIYREIFVALTSGACLCVPSDVEAAHTGRMLTWLGESQSTIVHAVPSIVQNWIAELPSDVSFGSWRALFLVGEPLRDGLVRKCRAACPSAQIVNLYGSTETNLAKCFSVVPPEPVPGIQPVGRPLPETQVLVLRPDGHLCGIGEPGEIVFRSHFLSNGYLDPQEPGKKAFSPGAYATGDRGAFRVDGTLQLFGRSDAQVKINGVRVEPEEVTAVLSSHPRVVAAIAVARDDENGSKQLVAYVVPIQPDDLTAASLRTYAASWLPSALVPAHVVFLERLPLNAGGKIDLAALPQVSSRPARAQVTASAFITPVQEMLADIWRGILRRDDVGLDDDFFDLGGHSLLAMRVVAHVERTIGVELPLRTVFTSPTVRTCALEIERCLRDPDGQSLMPIERRADRDQAPLSRAQQGLWFVEQLSPGTAAYNIWCGMRLTGRLDLGALEGALHDIVTRHETLRTHITTRDEQPVQVIEPTVPVSVPVVDLRPFPADARQVEAQRIATEEANRPFDLTRGPLWRVSLVRLTDDDYLMLATMHHIISDGWSLATLVREFAAAYEARTTGAGLQLPDLSLQYGDYANWQRQWLQDATIDDQLRYWVNHLSGAPVLDLPTDWQRSARVSAPALSEAVELGQALSEGVKELSRRENVTPFMVLLAAFQVLLSRYSGQTDIIVGTPMAGRTRAELEGLIGLFVNTLVLRTDLSGTPSFRELLERVRDTALDGYAHEDLPFTTLVEALKPERHADRNPLYQVMFQVDYLQQPQLAMPDLTIRPFDVLPASSKVDVLLQIALSDRGYHAVLQYRADLFAPERMRRMLDDYRTVLERASADPTLSILACSQPPSSEVERLTSRFTGALR